MPEKMLCRKYRPNYFMKILVTLFLVSQGITAQTFDHSKLDGLLRKYVNSNGRVNYEALKNTDAKTLDAYLAALASAKPEKLGHDEKLAFWINAYNAFVLKGVLKQYPVSSIKTDSDDFFKENNYVIAGSHYSLNDIENVIRPQFNDARVHFVLVCAAIGCPNLYNGALTGTTIQSILESRTKDFATNPAKIKVDAENQKIYLNKILEWYQSDFKNNFGSVQNFLKKYIGSEASTYSVEYVEYDWKLNDVKN